MSIAKNKRMFRFMDKRRKAAQAAGRNRDAASWWQLRIMLIGRILYKNGAKL